MPRLSNPDHLYAHLEESKRLVQQSKERIAESKRLQETYDEIQRASYRVLKEVRNRRHLPGTHHGQESSSE